MGMGAPNQSRARSCRTPRCWTGPPAACIGDSQLLRISRSHCRGVDVEQHGREALEASVTWSLCPVSFQMSQVSTVPKHSSPRAACVRAPASAQKSSGALWRKNRRPAPGRSSAGWAPPGPAPSGCPIPGGPAALPDDCRTDRGGLFFVPNHGGFPLVGDANGGNVRG